MPVALKEYLEEIEDYETAIERKGGETVSLEEAKKTLGIK